MRVAIIGGGFTGLAAAYELTKRGHRVMLFEKETVLGGLAYGFKEPSWKWHLEYTYHHWFTNDQAILSLINELGLGDKLIIKRPITATLWKNRMYQLDSPLHLFLFPGLSWVDKFRTAFLLGILKLNPFWQPLEGITAEQLFTSIGGKRAWQTIWKPLLYGKFGDLAPTVAASWFWARIKKRTPRLGYIEGGFQTLITALTRAIVRNGGKIYTGIAIDSVRNESGKSKNHNSVFIIPASPAGRHNSRFDAVLLTVPTPIAKIIAPIIPDSYFTIPSAIPHLHAQTLILETREPICASQPRKVSPCEANSKSVYWLNICDRSFPFLAVVAHTNFMNPKHYGGNHLTYFGNYLPQGHPYLSMTKKELFKVFLPFIKRLTHNSKFVIHNSFLFIGPFAQPVHQLHYSRKAPQLVTPVPGLYLANMDSIYPWDRGTNYAVELGIRAAEKIIKSTGKNISSVIGRRGIMHFKKH